MTNTMDIRAPQDQTEGTRSQVLRWLKTVGDAVAEHEPLIEIETDKVTVEVPAPAAGVLREIVKAEQEEIAPGDLLGRIEAVGQASLASENKTAGGAETRAADQKAEVALNAGAPAPGEAQDSSPGERQPLPDATFSAPSQSPTSATFRLSPAVRRLITERGLDPSVIRGTGEGRRITVDDVLAHKPGNNAGAPVKSASKSTTPPSSQGTAQSAVPAARSQPPVQSTIPVARSVPHTSIRKRIATHMVQSLLQTAPHVTTVFEADLTAIQAHRAAHRADFDQRGAPLTLTAYFIAATVNAIRAVPEANSRWTDTALDLYDEIHIGVATAIEGKGLVVPVLKHVESRDLFGIAATLHRLVTAAREDSLDPADVRGGTFTISNHGVSGSLLATPIVINQPQSAILGIGKLEKRPVVVEQGEEERLVIRPKCYITLTIDHRVMDGHQANHFLQVFVRTLENWPAK